ncbi:MAG: dUTP diphosphatase [Clostridia bacterium]|nr:dUTP diphosphatase [Clostridia bacterium]
MVVNFKKLTDKAVKPTFGTEFSAGADLYSTEKVVIGVGETKLINTGLALEIPVGYVGLIYARSGLATKRGLAPANKVGVIDSDYRGEIMVALYNQSGVEQVVEQAERVAQMVITPYLKVEYQQVEDLTDTARGQGGFGSTGSK